MTIRQYVPCKKIEQITRTDISANSPNNRQKGALKYYKAWHTQTELSFIIFDGHIMGTEEGGQFDW